MATEMQVVDLEQDIGPNIVKVSASNEFVWRRGALTLARFGPFHTLKAFY